MKTDTPNLAPNPNTVFETRLKKTGRGGYLGIGPRNGSHDYLPLEDKKFDVKQLRSN